MDGEITGSAVDPARYPDLASLAHISPALGSAALPRRRLPTVDHICRCAIALFSAQRAAGWLDAYHDDFGCKPIDLIVGSDEAPFKRLSDYLSHQTYNGGW